jgi:hypothetical protein
MNTPKEVFEWVKRFGTEDDKKRYRILWAEMQKMDKRIKELEKIHDKHMAPQMFDKKSDKETLIQLQIEKTRKELERAKLTKKWTQKERLASILINSGKDSKEWAQALKWGRLTDTQAMLLIEKEKVSE